MRNLIIVAREEVVRWLRIKAARQDTSVSRLVGRFLEERMSEEEGYAAAMRRFLAREPVNSSGGLPYPTREELHDRAGFR